jgi:hypothetical protein
LAVVCILLFTGWKGWEMVYRHRVGVVNEVFKEFAAHQGIAHALKAKIFFANERNQRSHPRLLPDGDRFLYRQSQGCQGRAFAQ